MKLFRFFLIFVQLTFASAVAGADDVNLLLSRAQRFFEPLSASMPGAQNDTPARVELGRRLFFDQRLSINDTQSCASCHRLDAEFAGVDNLPTSPGARGQRGTRNSPTVLNAGFQVAQFWDGRADDLVAQAQQPILNPIEMGMPDAASVEQKIRRIDEYQAGFAVAFPESAPFISYQHLAEAIAAFERTLITPSRFDDFLRGDKHALTMDEQRGLSTFLKVDCNSCHDGMLLGGETFEPLGKENPYQNTADLGVYEVTGDESERMYFKVAPLRNVALTAPYFHDGSIDTLNAAIRQMAYLQLDLELDQRQVADIASFLRALTDKQREQYLQ